MGHYKIKIDSQKGSPYVVTTPPSQEATKPGRVMVPDLGQSRKVGTAMVVDAKEAATSRSKDTQRIMTEEFGDSGDFAKSKNSRLSS